MLEFFQVHTLKKMCIAESVKFEKHEKIKLGKAEMLREGKDISIIAIGKRVSSAIKLAQNYKEKGIDAEVISF